MRDEDDDLLRAAEERGIDLSGVRAAAGNGAGAAPEEDPVAEVDAHATADTADEIVDLDALVAPVVVAEDDDADVVDIDIDIDAEAPAET
jgi:DNA-directed RNA polymerase subunit beta